MSKSVIKVAELFAGVGGFRLALDGYNKKAHPEFKMPSAGNSKVSFKTVWANQWEPPGTEGKQFAWRCYEERFGNGSCVNVDINEVMNINENVERGELDSKFAPKDVIIPEIDMVVGGFPCQDYSVAKPLAYAGGIQGKKGVLWWDIYRFIKLKQPRYVLLENVDRLLKSPSTQRGRDFAIMLSCFSQLGYSVEWRVINAAEYGNPQKRRRVFIYAERTNAKWDLQQRVFSEGVLAEALPLISAEDEKKTFNFEISDDPYKVSKSFGKNDKVSRFQNAGAMQNGKVFTTKVEPKYDGPFKVLADIMVPDTEVPKEFFIPRNKIAAWKRYREAKREKRIKPDGFEYFYTEGAMAWPDPTDKPARTILTGEGGAGASRSKHAVRGDSGKIRRLVPDELDQIQGFPKGWTATNMSDGRRAFCMGNALVVNIPHEIGKVIAKRHL